MKIVWDWNGTLYDDIQQGFNSIYKLCKKYGIPPLENLEEYREVFDFPVIDYYRQVGFDFDKLDWDTIAHEFMAHYDAQVPDIKLFDDAVEALERSKKNGWDNILLSASKIDALKEQIAPFDLEKHFEGVYGLGNIYAHSKAELAKEFMKNVDENEPVFFIGDTLHDVEVAKEAGANAILVDRGHQSRKRLEASGVPVFSDFNEAFNYLESQV